jgi:hypothetical protein
MMFAKLPTQKILLELLRYDPESGLLYWRSRSLEWFKVVTDQTTINARSRWNARHAEKVAFTSNSRGYYTGSILAKNYFAHRVIWKMVHGVEPKVIDHINGNGLDNRITNLRSVSQSINCRNARTKSNNTSGINGVSLHADTGKFRANLTVDGKQHHLGLFSTVGEAEAARKMAEKKHGFHINHGRAA